MWGVYDAKIEYESAMTAYENQIEKIEEQEETIEDKADTLGTKYEPPGNAESARQRNRLGSSLGRRLRWPLNRQRWSRSRRSAQALRSVSRK